MKLLKVISMAIAAAAVSGAANAATTFTEGARADILGSTRVTNDGSGTGDTTGMPPGFDLGTVGTGSSVELYGRIIEITDFYNFTATENFRVEWIFDGYTTANGVEELSGYNQTPVGGSKQPSTAEFAIGDNGGMIAAATFTTNINAGTGDPANIFGMSFGPGDYLFQVDGANPNFDGLYDIRFVSGVVPLPAGGLLMLTALGGLGLARRRRG